MSGFLGLAHPILQAPMAGVSTPAMAAAVSEAGGLGAIAIGAATVDAARAAIRDLQARTARPFNVNVFCHPPAVRDAAREAAWLAHLAPHFAELAAAPPAALREIYTSFRADDAMCALLVELRPAVVSCHFGLPTDAQLAALKQAGIRLLATATNLDEARQLEAAGVDGIVAQGFEAGGHRGQFDPDAPDPQLTTFALTRLLAARCATPIVAAGGIMDGAGIRAALDLGAAAAQLGTAFVLCPESAADEAYRTALRSARTTTFTSGISGRPARGLPNRLYDAGGAPAAYPLAYDAGKALHAAAKARGSDAYAAQWAGQGAPLARALPAHQLMEELIRELG